MAEGGRAQTDAFPAGVMEPVRTRQGTARTEAVGSLSLGTLITVPGGPGGVSSRVPLSGGMRMTGVEFQLFPSPYVTVGTPCPFSGLDLPICNMGRGQRSGGHSPPRGASLQKSRGTVGTLTSAWVGSNPRSSIYLLSDMGQVALSFRVSYF